MFNDGKLQRRKCVIKGKSDNTAELKKENLYLNNSVT